MVEVFGDVGLGLKKGDRNSFIFVVDEDEGFGFLELLEVDFLQTCWLHLNINVRI